MDKGMAPVKALIFSKKKLVLVKKSKSVILDH
jgi:hypothetical protein